MIDWPSFITGFAAAFVVLLLGALMLAVWLANGEADDPTYDIEREP